MGAGVHAAVQYTREDGDGLGPWSGWASTIRLGQLLTPRLGLGLAIDFGSTSGDGQTASLVGLGLAGQVELIENLALHAGVGLGVSACRTLPRTSCAAATAPATRWRSPMTGFLGLAAPEVLPSRRASCSGPSPATPPTPSRSSPGSRSCTGAACPGSSSICPDAEAYASAP